MDDNNWPPFGIDPGLPVDRQNVDDDEPDDIELKANDDEI